MPKGVYERNPKPPFDRFIAKVHKTASGCWNWIGSKDKRGYGSFSWGKGKSKLALRFSYFHYNGTLPKGMDLDHLCRNTSCVNPNHLEAVTHKENSRRGIAGLHMIAKSAALKRCPKGHAYSAKNTYLHRGKYKQCRRCKSDHQNIARAK